ncbi:MAG: YebC/PmpR family DNA-binding transcriptional regulator [Patescibacteria group bacterium]
MSGHSKWATTKRQKAIVDAKKGTAFTKIAKILTVAGRKGSDPTTNFSLRIAIEKAHAVNMPKDNIDRAIKRGIGELNKQQIDELVYEGIGPAKTQFIIKCLTDNKNRSVAEIRHLFIKHNGSLGATLWNFKQQGIIRITNYELQNKNLNYNKFELEIIDQEIEDIIKEKEGTTIYTKPENLQKIKQFLENKNIKTESAEIEYIAKEQITLSSEEKIQVEKFIEELENNEDVADYYTNTNF